MNVNVQYNIKSSNMSEEERIPCLDPGDEEKVCQKSNQTDTENVSVNCSIDDKDVTDGQVPQISEVPTDAVSSSDESKVKDDSDDNESHNSGEIIKECNVEKRKKNKVRLERPCKSCNFNFYS